MEKSSTCPKTEKCPIFNGILQGTEYVETYQKLYCNAGESGRMKCKRFQVAERLGYCPEKVLPNSIKSVDEILAENQKKPTLL